MKKTLLRLPLLVVFCISTISPLAAEGAREAHAEQADHPHRHHVGIWVHPDGGFKFLLAPGLETHSGHTEFLVRAGAYYDFRVKSLISPTVNVDFVDGEEILVYGLTFGRGF